MRHKFTLEYWIDDGWYVGKLKEVPGVFSQAESLEALEENIRDAYSMLLDEPVFVDRPDVRTREITVDVV